MNLEILTEEQLKNSEKIHFIGIGGSGMLPLVQILHKEGHNISGSDNNETKNTMLEQNMGINVTIGQNTKNIIGADLIIYSAAILKDNEELIAAFKSQIPTVERSILLGTISRRYGNAVGISGTHGKTTTSSMLTQILFDSKKDPSAILGGYLASIGGNGRKGESDIIVIEACEYANTFLQINPDIAVILNIDNDHLEFFKNMDNLKSTFLKYAKKTKKYVVANGDDAQTKDALKDLGKEIIWFGKTKNCNYIAKNIDISIDGEKVTTKFDVYKKENFFLRAVINVPGEYNVLNAMAAIACGDLLGVSSEEIKQGLLNFHGAGRRFEILTHHNGITVADDYAHHPTEMKVTLEAVNKMKFKNVWLIFQPFTFSRTALMFDDFVSVLKNVDNVLLTPIMGGREKNTYNIYSEDFLKKLDNAKVFTGFVDIKDYAIKNAKPGDLILTMGCGDVDKVANMIKKEYDSL